LIKPLWALAGVAFLGTAGVAGAVVVAPFGGEEEVVSQEEATAEPRATASPQGDPEGWVRFTHPGTAEAPPFSFAYPGEWHLREPELVPATLPKGEPLGTAVQIMLSTWDPGASPIDAQPPEAIRLEVYAGPVAPYTKCPPNQGGLNDSIGGIEGRRFVAGGGPPGITRIIVAYAYDATEIQCYAFFGYFSQTEPDETTFDRIAESFHVGQEVPTVSPNTVATITPAPTSPSPVAMSTWNTFTNTAYGYSFEYPAGWLINPYDARDAGTSDLVHLHNVMPPETGSGGRPPPDRLKIEFLVLENPGQLSVEQWVSESNARAPSAPTIVSSAQISSAGGLTGIQQVWRVESYGDFYTVYFAHSENVYIINGPQSDSLFLKQYRQVIDSFRLTG
jgi:hypothetical protein